jgi:hypothetical protein
MAKVVQKSKKRAAGTRQVARRGEAAATKSIKIDKAATRFIVGSGHVDVDKVAAEFNLTKASLAQALGFAEETLQRSARASAQKTQQRLREMLEILTRVAPWAGGMPQAMGWYRGQGIPALGDQTAEALVKSDQAAVVRAYLDGIATGAFA